ncbi:hypothetical protein BJ742DRAFT_682746, partial [Cladochytrium replicatum]
VRLVAVSKTKPNEDILAVYEEGHRHFGENIQELVDKAEKLPRDINWHFIGSLQSNKCKVLAAVPSLYAVETLDSIKKADLLNKHSDYRTTPLRVFVQINTSGEESKSGVQPEEALSVCEHIIRNCPHLELAGLMTIGSPENSERDDNPDFVLLREKSQAIAQSLSLSPLELSMGMSDDFEAAIAHGSTNIRVGSTIFGARSRKT